MADLSQTMTDMPLAVDQFPVTRPAPGVAVITMTPLPGAKVFQFSSAALAGLRRTFTALEAEPEMKAVVITGTGRVFAAGADIAEMSGYLNAEDPVERGTAFAARGQRLMDHIAASRLFTVAAINGAALGGGCELAMACDWRIAAGTAIFGQPEVNLGLIPGWGGTRRLAALVGPARATRLIMTGDLIKAPVAADWQLVNEVVEPTALLDSAVALATTVGTKSATVLAACKGAVRAGLLLDDAAGEAAERAAFGRLFDGGTNPDTVEGITAFIEKRQPVFGH